MDDLRISRVSENQAKFELFTNNEQVDLVITIEELVDRLNAVGFALLDLDAGLEGEDDET